MAFGPTARARPPALPGSNVKTLMQCKTAHHRPVRFESRLRSCHRTSGLWAWRSPCCPRCPSVELSQKRALQQRPLRLIIFCTLRRCDTPFASTPPQLPTSSCLAPMWRRRLWLCAASISTQSLQVRSHVCRGEVPLPDPAASGTSKPGTAWTSHSRQGQRPATGGMPTSNGDAAGSKAESPRFDGGFASPLFSPGAGSALLQKGWQSTSQSRPAYVRRSASSAGTANRAGALCRGRQSSSARA